jgi:hypothetical protein
MEKLPIFKQVLNMPTKRLSSAPSRWCWKGTRWI